jgi:hypothetical protein
VDAELDIEASLARFHAAMDGLARTLEELGAASIAACDRAAAILGEVDAKLCGAAEAAEGAETTGAVSPAA